MHVAQRIREAFERAGQPIADDVLEELTEHAESVIQSCRAAGASEDTTRREVDREIQAWVADAPRHGRRTPVAPAPPPTSGGRLAAFVRDLTYAARVLRRRPAPALVGVATIALGMTAVTLMVTVCWGVLKPLPWPHADRLVRIYEGRKGGANRFGQFGPLVTNVTYLAWQQRPQTIDAIGGWSDGEATLNGTGPAERLRRASVTPSLFDVLEAAPILGRRFAPADAAPGAAPVIIVSYELWQQRFGGRRDVLGQSLRLDGSPITIVGVMPPGFAFPNHEVRAWVPKFVPDLLDKKHGGVKLFSAMARLRPGMTVAQASAEAAARADAAPKAAIVGKAIFGVDAPAEVTLVPALEDETKEVRPALIVLLVAAGLLLTASAANIANVQLARTVARRRELAVRAALGATAAQLARQLLLESALIGIGGGLAGLVLAAVTHRVLPTVLPEDFPRLAEIHLTAGTALVALVVAAIAGAIAGVLPAIHAGRTAIASALSEDSLAPVGMSLRATAARLRLIPMAGQVTVATVLLVGASLLARTFVEMIAADRGFQIGHVLTVEIPFPPGAMLARRTEVLDAVLDRIAGLPGVVHVGYTSILPLTDSESMKAFEMPNPRKGGARVTVRTAHRVVSPDYLPALGVRLLAGRQFSTSDTAASQRVAIVNETFARAYLGDDPLSAKLPADHDGWPDTAIVGVVNDVRADAATSGPEMFVPVPQYPDVPGGDPMVTIRTAGNPGDLAPVVRDIVREVDATLALGSVMSMEDRLLERLARPRLYSMVLAAFAGVTLLVAAVGLFGVLSYSVMQRSREMAVRAALGASPARLLRMVVMQGLAMTAVGLAAGLVSAYALARSMAGLLVGITASDPASYAAAAAVLLVASVLACAVPAIRAARLDPMTALKRT